jgi:hypothetical protein
VTVIDHRIKEKEKERGRERERMRKRENATVHYITLRTWTCVTHPHPEMQAHKETYTGQTDRQRKRQRKRHRVDTEKREDNHSPNILHSSSSYPSGIFNLVILCAHSSNDTELMIVRYRVLLRFTRSWSVRSRIFTPPGPAPLEPDGVCSSSSRGRGQ